MAVTPDDRTELKMTIEGALQRYIEAGGDDIEEVYNLVDAAWVDAVDAVADELKNQPAMTARRRR